VLDRALDALIVQLEKAQVRRATTAGRSKRTTAVRKALHPVAHPACSLGAGPRPMHLPERERYHCKAEASSNSTILTR